MKNPKKDPAPLSQLKMPHSIIIDPDDLVPIPGQFDTLDLTTLPRYWFFKNYKLETKKWTEEVRILWHRANKIKHQLTNIENFGIFKKSSI